MHDPETQTPVVEAATRLVQRFAVPYSYDVIFTRRVFAPDNDVLQTLLQQAGPGPHRLAVFIDSGVARSFPGLAKEVTTGLEALAPLACLAAAPQTVSGGEAAKQDSAVLDTVLKAVRELGICRQSFILAIGGGAMLDAVGFAAATAHRGVRLLRMPSTVLAQNDAGVGVKNGINLFGRKNFWGVHAPPYAVINDFSLLQGLEERDLRAGIAEAVKVALIRDKAMFHRLQHQAEALAALEPQALEEMIKDCAAAHLDHIVNSGDPFERHSARPLDFGHWAAHALEEESRHGLRHGEAVAVGMALDSAYSQLCGMLSREDLQAILGMLEALKLPVCHQGLAELDIQGALDGFREHLGGRLHISLLSGVGQSVEVNHIDTARMQQARDTLMQRRSACRTG